MRRKQLLDTFAVLAWLQDEPSASAVESILQDAKRDGAELLMTLINLGELYYILRRSLSAIETRALLDMILDLPVRAIPVSEDLVWEAAEIKARNPLSYADCIAVAAARREGAALVTGDPEFKRVEGMVCIKWLTRG
ncbi:MAG: type II toxin-antitoxin system VapC family toxin [Armatimonadetes bacterium]|nr:type II toxin-antitoxin system VapC family toxin [Armatimonadota bacterium]